MTGLLPMLVIVASLLAIVLHIRWLYRTRQPRWRWHIWAGRVSHLIPDGDPHDTHASGTCPCQPERILVDGRVTWVHRERVRR